MSALGKRKFAFISALLLTCVTATAAAFCQMNEMNQTSFGVVVVGHKLLIHTKEAKLVLFYFFNFFLSGSDPTKQIYSSVQVESM